MYVEETDWRTHQGPLRPCPHTWAKGVSALGFVHYTYIPLGHSGPGALLGQPRPN